MKTNRRYPVCIGLPPMYSLLGSKAIPGELFDKNGQLLNKAAEKIKKGIDKEMKKQKEKKRMDQSKIDAPIYTYSKKETLEDLQSQRRELRTKIKNKLKSQMEKKCMSKVEIKEYLEWFFSILICTLEDNYEEFFDIEKKLDDIALQGGW